MVNTVREDTSFLQEQTSSDGSYKNMHNFVSTLRFLQAQDLDAIIPVTGEKGSGKSTFILQAIRTYLEKYCPDVSLQKDLKKFVMFDSEETQENLVNGEEYMPISIDEAVRFMLGEDHAKGESKDTKKLFVQMRIKHRLVFAAIPSMFFLDSKYREMCGFWVHIVGRGKAILFTKDRKIAVRDPWHRKEFENMAGNITLFTDVDKIIDMYKKHPCFLDVITFPKVDEDLHKKYMELRMDSLMNEKDEIKTGFKGSIKDAMWAMVLYQDGYSYRDIASTIKRHEKTVVEWFTQMRLNPVPGIEIKLKYKKRGNYNVTDPKEQIPISEKEMPPLQNLFPDKVQ